MQFTSIHFIIKNKIGAYIFYKSKQNKIDTAAEKYGNVNKKSEVNKND